jgi:O-antigen/teichoic acid export membrane protein
MEGFVFFKKVFSSPYSFLLENNTVRQTIFKNTFWLSTAEGISRLLKIALIIYVARILGAVEYGKFTFALAFVSIFAVFSDFGLTWTTTREFSQEEKKEKEFSSILSLKIILSLATLILIIGSSLFITSDLIIQKIVWILGIYVVIDSFNGIIWAALRARQKMEYEAWGKIIRGIILICIGFFILFKFPSIQGLSYSYLIASCVAFIFIIFIFHFKIFRLNIKWEKNIWKRFLGLSWPLAFISVFTLIYTNIDSVMMGYWGQITQTGWYNAAYRIISATLIPMSLISISFFPALNKAFKKSKDELQDIWNHQIKLITILIIPLMVGGIFLASKIINFIYGSAYGPSILAFQILILVSVFIFLSEPYYRLLIVFKKEKIIFCITLLGAIINIILNIILIPRYSLYGAAIATVITYFILFLLFVRLTNKFSMISLFNSEILKTWILSIFSSLMMFFVISYTFVYKFNILLIILIGIGIYFFTFVILKYFLKIILSKKICH